MWSRGTSIVVGLLLFCGVTVAQQTVELKLCSGEHIEGILTDVGDDSLQILKCIEVEKPFKHERNIPVKFALNDVLAVAATSGLSTGDVASNRAIIGVLGTVAAVAVVSAAVGKDEGNSWPFAAQLLAGVGVGVVCIVGATVWTASSDKPDPGSYYWIRIPEHLEALKIMAVPARGMNPLRVPAASTVMELADEYLESICIQLHTGSDIYVYLYDIDEAGVVVISRDAEFLEKNGGRGIGRISWDEIRAFTTFWGSQSWQGDLESAASLRKLTFVECVHPHNDVYLR